MEMKMVSEKQVQRNGEKLVIRVFERNQTPVQRYQHAENYFYQHYRRGVLAETKKN